MSSDSPNRHPVEELAEQFLELYRRGERPSPEAFALAHPELAGTIRELFPALVLLEEGRPAQPPVAAAAEPHATRILASDFPGVQGSELNRFLAPAQSPKELGRLGSYRLLRVLGAGGMGVVFQAEDTELGRCVALKVMKPELAALASAKRRFLREGRSAASIRNDHVVTVYQAGEANGVPYLAMELLEGESLAERLNREGRLSVAEVVRIGREVALGLDAAHKCGLLHRDVKPANVWLEAAHGRVKLLDFGLARSAERAAGLTQQGDIVGTPAYMAPEQASGQDIDHRCDLFSLGCVLYHLATGQPPFQGKDAVATLVAVRSERPLAPRERNPGVPAGLSELIVRLLAKDPKQRPPTAQDLAESLQRMGQEVGETLETRAELLPSQPRRASSGRGVVLLVLAVLVLVPVGYFLGDALLTTGREPRIETARSDPAPAAQDVQAQGAADANRRVAELVLKAGGELWVAAEGSPTRVSGPLPSSPFTIHQIDLKPPVRMDDATVGILRGITGLRSLSFLEQPISNVGLATLANEAGFTTLTQLTLAGTKITDDGLTRLQRCRELTRLNLSGSAVRGAGLKHLRALPHLRILTLNNTAVSDDLAGLRNLPLMDLSLGFCSNLTDTSLEHVGTLTALEELSLWQTPIGDEGLSHLKSLARLRTLGLEGSQVTGAGLKSVAACKRLELLKLEALRLRDADLAQLRGLGALEFLSLRDTPVTDAGLEHLEGLTRLKIVQLETTQVTANGVRKLRDALPGCRVDWVQPSEPSAFNAAEADRRAAEWVLTAGGKLALWASGKQLELTRGSRLPPGAFRLTRIDFPLSARLDDAGLRHLRDFTNLGLELLLAGQPITDVGLAELATAPGVATLQMLELSSVKRLSDAGLEHLKHFRNLRTLNLAATGVRGPGLIHLRSLTQVRHLTLAELPLKDADLAELRGRPLTWLDLSQCPNLTAAGMEHVATLERLEQLDLVGTRVANEGLARLKGLANLRRLNLAGFKQTRGSDVELAPLSSLARLEFLDLSSTPVRDAGLEPLKSLKKLREVRLEATKVSAAGVRQLQESLPGCTITSDFASKAKE